MYIVSDLVNDSSVNFEYTLQGILSFGQINRSFVVAEIDTQVSDPQLFGTQAVAFVEAQVPIGTPHPDNSLCTARGYQMRSIMSHNSVQVIASYIYNQTPTDTTIWQIESSTSSEMLETDQQYTSETDPTLIPVKVGNYIRGWSNYLLDPPVIHAVNPGSTGTDEPPQPPSYGTVVAAKLLKRWDYTRQVYSASQAIAFDNATLNYVNRINSTIYRGTTQGATAQNLSLDVGTVYCAAAGVNFNPYEGQYLARCTMIYKPEKWQPWSRYVDPLTHTAPSNIWRKGTNPVTGQPYDANGTEVAVEFLSADLNQLLGLITGT